MVRGLELDKLYVDFEFGSGRWDVRLTYRLFWGQLLLQDQKWTFLN